MSSALLSSKTSCLPSKQQVGPFAGRDRWMNAMQMWGRGHPLTARCCTMSISEAEPQDKG